MRTLLRGVSQFAVLMTLLTALQAVHGAASVRAAPSESAVSTQTDSTPTFQELEHGISDRLKRVEEFRFIEEEAAKLGVRAWLFGGTAAGYAHYVKWDLQREKGDQRFQKDRFDYDYTNIYRSTQDLDIVIDGNAEQAQELQAALQQKYPHLQGSKTAWEVRLLTQDMGDKQAILNNPDFMNQHTDSNSTGVIEITKPKAGEHVVRDVRDWNSKEPFFLKDIHDGALHYYFSPQHNQTKFAQEGRNPPILSAIRYLTKAFQYELKLRPEDLSQIRKIIREFDPQRDTRNSFVAKWIEKNGKKLIQNAVNIEYAWNTLEELGLRKKLESIKGNSQAPESLAWWMNKEPLRTSPVGQGAGKTAKELGLDIVAHETNNFLAYESITRAHTGASNVLISRKGAAGEVAMHGNGFYTKDGREGARGTGLTIRFHLDPNAREGDDFIRVPENGYVIVKNKAALRVIPESLNIGPVEYFQMLAENKSAFNGSDRGILEKLKRRIESKQQALSEEQVQSILEIVRAQVKSNKPFSVISPQPVITEWLSLKASRAYPDIIKDLLKKPGPYNIAELMVLGWPYLSDHPNILKSILESGCCDSDVAKALSNPAWIKHPEIVDTLVRKGTADGSVAFHILSKEHWKNHPEWVDALIQRGEANREIAKQVISKSFWMENPKWQSWVDQLLKKYDYETYDNLASSIFKSVQSTQRPDRLKAYLDKGQIEAVLFHVLSEPHWKDPELLKRLMKDRNFHHSIASKVLSQPQWSDHPEFVIELLKADSVNDYFLNQLIFEKPHWRNNPELRRLAGGADPTAHGLRKALKAKSFDTLEIVRSPLNSAKVVSAQPAITELRKPTASRDYPDVIKDIQKRAGSDHAAMIKALESPNLSDHPNILKSILENGCCDSDVAAALSKPAWIKHPEIVDTLVRKGTADGSVVFYILSKEHWKNHPEWVDTLIERGKFNWEIAKQVISKSFWMENPKWQGWVDQLLKSYDYNTYEELAPSIFKSVQSTQRPDRLKAYLDKGHIESVLSHVLTEPHWKDPKLLKRLMKDRNFHQSIASKVLPQPHWADHPDFVIELVKAGSVREDILDNLILSKPHWRNNPELRRLVGGADPTAHRLKEGLKSTSFSACILRALSGVFK